MRVWSIACLFVLLTSIANNAQNPPGTVLAYSTYLGGSGIDQALAMAVDASGNTYISGVTYSADFPITPGAYQSTSAAGQSNCPPFGSCWSGFISKFDPSGSKLVYSTFFPGFPSSIAVDAGGALYVAGAIVSGSFPVTAGALNGVGKDFLAKLDATGSSLVFGARFGSSAYDDLHALALDAGGNAYVTGTSYGPDYPVTPGAFQTPSLGAFVTKISADGKQMIYSARLGGSDTGNANPSGTQPRSIAVDPAGQAFVAGLTDAHFPTTPTAYQLAVPARPNAFLAKLSADGSTLLYSTVIGDGSTNDLRGYAGAYKVAVDRSGFAYIAGRFYNGTHAKLPVTPGAYQRSYGWLGSPFFVAKFDPSQSGARSLVFSTLLDGPGAVTGFDNMLSGLAVDVTGRIYVTGNSGIRAFPTTQNAITGCATGNQSNFFVAVLSASGGNLIFGTRIGGSLASSPVGLGLDSSGKMYVAGYTTSTDFPVTPGARQNMNKGGGYDAFVLRIDPGVLLQLASGHTVPPLWEVCSPASTNIMSSSIMISAVLQAAGPSPSSISVIIDGGLAKRVSNQAAIWHQQPIKAGKHIIKLQATRSGVTTNKTISVVAP